jgi:hypothetical protein
MGSGSLSSFMRWWSVRSADTTRRYGPTGSRSSKNTRSMTSGRGVLSWDPRVPRSLSGCPHRKCRYRLVAVRLGVPLASCPCAAPQRLDRRDGGGLVCARRADRTSLGALRERRGRRLADRLVSAAIHRSNDILESHGGRLLPGALRRIAQSFRSATPPAGLAVTPSHRPLPPAGFPRQHAGECLAAACALVGPLA